MVFLCMAGTDIIGDNRLKIIYGRRKTEKNFRLGCNQKIFILLSLQDRIPATSQIRLIVCYKK